MFSQAPSRATTGKGGRREATTCMAPIMAAAPAMSVCIPSIPAWDFNESPPESKVTALPTQ